MHLPIGHGRLFRCHAVLRNGSFDSVLRHEVEPVSLGNSAGSFV